MWGHQLVWMEWQSIRIVGVSACVILILHQKIQKMAKCAFWYQLTRVVPDKVQIAVKWLCVCLCFQLPSAVLLCMVDCQNAAISLYNAEQYHSSFFVEI